MAIRRQLRSMIYSKYDSEAAFARSIHWSRQKLNKITTGEKEPDLVEAKTIADALDISVDEIVGFFMPCSSPNEQQTV